MAREIIRCGTQTWVEVAPRLLTCHRYQKHCSTCPKLETVVEEGCENFELVPLPKRVSFFVAIGMTRK
ncbi:hypothetical protein PanWU01x14_064600 [Parasponia andersonii]|uniref:Uncharacterized protein n=1 Tax=Parasponia andersonii TaxID=3476 RepID=A0A2P5DHB6_PARAD|nr:hypothetical protein PanWU01x14_064600 [Parasponia andersonii]